MEKKRSIGITLFAIYFILNGIIAIPGTIVGSFLRSSMNVKSNLILDIILAILCTIIFIACGIGLLKRKEWGRKLALIYPFIRAIFILLSIPEIKKIIQSMETPIWFFSYKLVIPIIILLYFTRSKVKEQFKQ